MIMAGASARRYGSGEPASRRRVSADVARCPRNSADAGPSRLADPGPWRDPAAPLSCCQSASPPAAMLISCVAYENGQKLADIPVEDISEYVKRPDCFVWVALFEPTREELDEMAEEFGLHELAVDDARSGHQRPKLEEYGDSLFAVLQPVEKIKGGR